MALTCKHKISKKKKSTSWPLFNSLEVFNDQNFKFKGHIKMTIDLKNNYNIFLKIYKLKQSQNIDPLFVKVDKKRGQVRFNPY